MATHLFSCWHVLGFVACAVLGVVWAARVYRNHAHRTPRDQALLRFEGWSSPAVSIGLAFLAGAGLIELDDRREQAIVATVSALVAVAAFALGLWWQGLTRDGKGVGSSALILPPLGRVARAACLIVIADAALILALLSSSAAQALPLGLFAGGLLVGSMLYLGWRSQ